VPDKEEKYVDDHIVDALGLETLNENEVRIRIHNKKMKELMKLVFRSEKVERVI